MNRYVFAARNIYDKLPKAARSWSTTKSYWRSYVLSKFENVEPDVYIVSYPKMWPDMDPSHDSAIP